MSCIRNRIYEMFSDVIAEANELVVEGRISTSEVVEAMAESFSELYDYNKKCGDAYQRMFDAISQQVRNK